MELFTPNTHVMELEATLAADGPARLDVLAQLAWHLRQRDTQRALQLAQEAEALAPYLGDARECRRLHARLSLLRAEAKWLFADIDSAARLMQEARDHFTAIGDAAGCADAGWLASWIAGERGDGALRDAELQIAIQAAGQAGDATRRTIADVALLRWRAFTDVRTAEALCRDRHDLTRLDTDPVLATWFNDFLGIVAMHTSEFGRAIERQIHAYKAALDTGQVQRAIVATVNIGVAFNNLGDYLSSLEWLDRGLGLARAVGWPGCIGMCLMQTAEPLRLLGRRDAARTMLTEALEILRPLDKSHNYGVALQYMGDVALDSGEYQVALDTFAMLEERVRQQSQTGISQIVQRGKAHALCRLDRPAEALDIARRAMVLAQQQGDTYNQIATLKVLADIHAMHPLPAPAGATAPTATLHFLEQALQVAATIKGYTVSGELLDTVSQEYAKAGDVGRAYDFALQANVARQKTHSQEATNRAIAMQVLHETESTRLQIEYHRQLAEAEASRVEVLQRTTTTLEALGAIGQEITAQLSGAAVFETINRHVHDLLDAVYLAIYLMDEAGEGLAPAFGIENGRPVALRYIALQSEYSDAARCVRERREINIDMDPKRDHAGHIPGTLRTSSVLFAPLCIGERILGVMSIQSMKRHAYGEREELIFRTLCAYGAIALDNARAYQQLNETLDQLRSTQQQLLEKNIELEHAYRQLEEQSLTDPLTGLRNRRFLNEQLDRDISLTLRRYDEYGRHGGVDPADNDLVFFMIDLDHFKPVNDEYGHRAGDAVLVQIRARLEAVFRESDYLIRWGGEEFLVVARGASREEAVVLAERVRGAIGEQPFLLSADLPIHKTCSIGFACFPFQPAHPRWLNWSQVLELADEALYMAKRGGRNSWVGLYATETCQPGETFPQFLHGLQAKIDGGALRAVSRHDHMHAGPPVER
jgi:diguanylate cyclase (GGDEF)-like protein